MARHGCPAGFGSTSLDGSLTTATVGADYRAGRWFGGVALSYSEGNGDYRYGAVESGELRSELTSINPYLRFERDDRTSFWGVLGLGSGEWSLSPEGSGAGRTRDLTTKTAAFGGRGVVSRTPGGFELAVLSDLRATETRADALSGDAGGRTGRARLLLEGNRFWALDSGGLLGMTLEAGLRADGGDAETGGGLSYASGRMALQANARTLAAHEDASYRESGASFSVLYRPQSDGSGLSLQLGSVWGAAASGVRQLAGRTRSGAGRRLHAHGPTLRNGTRLRHRRPRNRDTLAPLVRRPKRLRRRPGPAPGPAIHLRRDLRDRPGVRPHPRPPRREIRNRRHAARRPVLVTDQPDRARIVVGRMAGSLNKPWDTHRHLRRP